jgi:hypothetical protein
MERSHPIHQVSSISIPFTIKKSTIVTIIRAWCLLEVFYSIKNKVPFQVYLTQEQQRKLFYENVKIVSRISTHQSTCWVLNDQLRIHSIIENSVGFEAVDSKVREAIARALQVADSPPSQIQSRSQGTDERLALTAEDKEFIFILNWFQERGLIAADKEAKNVDAITVHFK